LLVAAKLPTSVWVIGVVIMVLPSNDSP